MPHRRAQEKVKWNPGLNGLGFPFDEKKYPFGLLLSHLTFRIAKKLRFPDPICNRKGILAHFLNGTKSQALMGQDRLQYGKEI